MPGKIFKSNFDDVSDFAGYYIESGSSYDSILNLVPGKYLRHSIVKARALNNEGVEGNAYKPHRAYPTVQMYKDNGNTGAFTKPTVTTMYVRIGIILKTLPGIDDWLSIATFCSDPSDNWGRTVLVNLSADGFLRLVHVPTQGEQTYNFQAVDRTMKCPRNQWFRLDVYLDMDTTNGYAKAYLNGKLFSWAEVRDTVSSYLAQAHFGMYSAARLATGYVDNAYLRIQEVDDEAEGLEIISTPITI